MTFSSDALTAFNTANAASSAAALAAGTLEILDSGGAILVSVGLGTPTSSGATTTMGGFPKTVTASATGTAASARYRTSAAANWKTGMSVGVSATDVVMTTLSVVSGQSITISSATLAHSSTSA